MFRVWWKNLRWRERGEGKSRGKEILRAKEKIKSNKRVTWRTGIGYVGV